MNRRPLPQVVLGLIVIAIGVVALLGQTGVIDAGSFFGTWWPLLVVSLGVAALVAAPRAWIGPLLVISIGIVLQLNTLGVIDVSFWDLVWPVVIILLGVAILLRVGVQTSDSPVVNSAVIWWGAERSSTAKEFKGGSLSAIMGGIEVDLREAEIVGRADISVFVWWGGVDIKVPPTWRVRVEGLPLLGGWENKTTAPPAPDAPELVIHATAIMGGVEIKN